LLFKLLDWQDRLSVQVHPPAHAAGQFGGETKTEMWYLLDALLDSDIYAGLRKGVTREQFDEALKTGHVADLIHRIPSRAGDAYFMPSGRIHALGAGNVVFEVQQNSDTTYRVFDWNRIGLDGKPRELHIGESLASIDFDDAEPLPVEPVGETVVACEFFNVERWEIAGARPTGTAKRFAVFCVASGTARCGGSEFEAGRFFLVPAGGDLLIEGDGVVLRTTV
jgi:mannose-6-phosphate isomerase